jgi:hypothetical protein
MMNDAISYRLRVTEGRKDLAAEYADLCEMVARRPNTENKIALKYFLSRNDVYLLGLV